jgi:prepilin-type N-terminal cleavage/methylation domain-containing protein
MARGFSLVELVVALTVGGLLAALLFGLLSSQLRLARQTADRIAAADAVRVTSHVIAGELRRMAPPDLRAIDRDSLSIRAYRGTAIVCATHGEHLGVRFRGDRLPDPAKDSILMVSPFAAEHAVRLLEVRQGASDSCTARPGETLLTWTVQPASSASVMLVFESGTYYLTTGALRCRLGAEGRQPVTAELFIPPFTRFVARPGAALSLTLATKQTRHVHVPVYFGTVAP